MGVLIGDRGAQRPLVVVEPLELGGGALAVGAQRLGLRGKSL
jgi:hypothetical protein